MEESWKVIYNLMQGPFLAQVQPLGALQQLKCCSFLTYPAFVLGFDTSLCEPERPRPAPLPTAEDTRILTCSLSKW